MSKSAVVSIIIGVVFILGAIGIVVSLNMNSAKVTNTKTGQTSNVQTSSKAYLAVDACSVLTETVSKNVLGSGATKADVSAGSTSSEALSVSNCVYTVKIDPSATKPNNTKGASVLARSARTQAGINSNKAQFGDDKPDGVQNVDDLGDKAYFNPKFNQLNVLKGSNWYIVTSYTGSVMNATLESNKQLAEQLDFK